MPGKLMTGSYCVTRTVSLTSSGHHGRTLVEKLSDYSVHRISTHELRNTVNYNDISETLDAPDLVESTKEYCGVRGGNLGSVE